MLGDDVRRFVSGVSLGRVSELLDGAAPEDDDGTRPHRSHSQRGGPRMGMSSRAIVRRLRAWHFGEPLTRGTTIHTATAAPADRLLLSFVKMGGETRPWALAWKRGAAKVQFRFVPEPRFRAGVDEMLAEFGPVLADHFRNPAVTGDAPEDASDLAPLRQLWVPNGSHVSMLHHFAYTYARRNLERDFAQELRLLGRTSLFLFLESQRPGQQLVMAGSDVLRSAYDFPTEDVRQAHLGFLLAWLSARGNRDHGIAAALEAERLPVATALDPTDERTELAPLVEEYNEARRADNSKRMKSAERSIGELLRPELERRLSLVSDAIDTVATDPRPVNRGVGELVQLSLKQQWSEYVLGDLRAIERGQEPYVPSPETDFDARGAASRYFRYEAAADRMFAALVHDDHELEAEAIASGRAFRGNVVKVRDEGSGRSTRPVLYVEDLTPGPLSLRVGDRVCFVGNPKREGQIRAIETPKGGAMVLVIEINKCKTTINGVAWPHSMHGADERWIGQPVTVIGTSFADMAEQKAWKIWEKSDRPGDWIVATRDAAG